MGPTRAMAIRDGIMKLTLHIGMEKTGSTSIQKALWSDRAAFATRGILVPTMFGSPNHMELAAAAMGARDQDEVQRYAVRLAGASDHDRFVADLERRIADEASAGSFERMVVSNEHCHSRLRTPEAAARAIALLGVRPEDTEVIIYLRRQDRVAVSLHSTRLKLGGVGRIFPLTRKGALDYYFRYDRVLETWAAVVGRERVTVRLYEKPRLTGGDVVADFYAAAGLGAPPANLPRDNASLGRAQFLFLTRFNQRFSKAAGDGLRRLRGPILNAIAEVGPKAPYRPARAEALAFYEAARASNAAVRAAWFPTLDRATLFDEDFSEYPAEADRETLTEDELFDFVEALWTFRTRRRTSA